MRLLSGPEGETWMEDVKILDLNPNWDSACSWDLCPDKPSQTHGGSLQMWLPPEAGPEDRSGPTAVAWS